MVRDDLADCDDPRVVAVMAELPRQTFVPDDIRVRAYDDGALPIGSGQTISQPRVVALMLAALRLRPGLRVLDVGCGSGYAAALLARLVQPGGSVCAVERIADLALQAARRLQPFAVEVRHADGSTGWPERAPFDAIHIAAASPAIPPSLLAQLAPGGRLVLPLGEVEGEQELVLIERTSEGDRRSSLGAVRFVPFLPGMG